MEKIPGWLIRLTLSLIAALLAVIIIAQIQNLKLSARSVDDKHIITISAQAKITASPDLAVINASVVTNNAATAVDAQTQNTAKMNAVIDFIKAQKVDSKDIKTSAYNIYPSYNYKSGTQSIIGYNANQTVTIKVRNLSIVGSLVDGLTKNGVNEVQNVSYTFDNPDNLREQAREQALASARDKAQRLATAAGAQLGGLVSFSEDQGGYPVPIPYAANAAMGLGGADTLARPPQIEPGTQDITANVTVTYTLK